MVPDDSLTIRERAIAAWPTAWGGQNQRDILVTLGYDVDRPWRELPQKDRDWILFTDEQPVVPTFPFDQGCAAIQEMASSPSVRGGPRMSQLPSEKKWPRSFCSTYA